MSCIDEEFNKKDVVVIECLGTTEEGKSIFNIRVKSDVDWVYYRGVKLENTDIFVITDNNTNAEHFSEDDHSYMDSIERIPLRHTIGGFLSRVFRVWP